MVQHLFPRFLENAGDYAAAEQYWNRLWDEVMRFSGQRWGWQTPWLRTTYADGTPMQDGDPILSARAVSRNLGVRVIQNPPRTQEVELVHWVDSVIDGGSGNEIRTLVIACALSKQAADLSQELMLAWIRHGSVSVSQADVGPPIVSAPPADHLLLPFTLFPPAPTDTAGTARELLKRRA